MSLGAAARFLSIALAVVGCRTGFTAEPSADAAVAADASAPDASPSVCGSKDVIAIDDSGTLIGSTSAVGNEFFGSCTGTKGPETVASIEVDEAVQDLVVTVPTADYNSSVYVRTDCGTSPTAEVGCSNDARAVVQDISPGKYFIFVDAADESSGSFSLVATKYDRVSSTCDPSVENRRCTVEAECIANTCQPATCGTADPQTDAFSVMGTTVGAPTIHVGSCNGGGFLAPEVIFQVTLTNAVSDLVATTDLPGSSYDTLLYLRDACGGTEIAGNDDVDGASNRSLLNSGPLEAGTYFLFVDGFAASSGTFELSVTLVP